MSMQVVQVFPTVHAYLAQLNMHLLLVFQAVFAYPVVPVMLVINLMLCLVNQISLAQVLFIRWNARTKQIVVLLI
jgi:hypothetical protein